MSGVVGTRIGWRFLCWIRVRIRFRSSRFFAGFGLWPFDAEMVLLRYSQLLVGFEALERG